MTEFRSGYAALVGRPNVGKSTLLNTVLGQKISIVTPRPQTTQKRILGIRTTSDCQIIFVDTPGIHKPVTRLGEYMNREASEAARDADVILFMVEPKLPGLGDRFILDSIGELGVHAPLFLLINKIDLIKKTELFPVIEAYSALCAFDTVFPLSAVDSSDADRLLGLIAEKLPEGPKYYPDDILTDQYERFVAAEIIRERVMMETKDEVPHAVAVEIAAWTEREDGLLSLGVNLIVERKGQKGIIIGKAGSRLKSIGSSARKELEAFLDRKVFLELWVKVREDWRKDAKILKELGFE